MDKKVTYLSKDFTDFKNSIIDLAQQQYPALGESFNDASVGSFLADAIAGVADSLSFHIDRVYQETNVESAQERSSVYSIARSNGIKIPGPKGAVTEVRFHCWLPNDSLTNDASRPNWLYAPIIKRGTKLKAGDQIFELSEDVNFGEIADKDGVPNRTHEKRPNNDGYDVYKLAVVTAGETKIYKKVFYNDEAISPFYEILIPNNNIMRVESIIAKEGVTWATDPSDTEFSALEEYQRAKYVNYDNGVATTKEYNLYKYFEVDSLAQQYRWGEVTDEDGQPIVEKYGYEVSNGVVTMPSNYVTKGEWKPLQQKYITEYTDKGYMKVIFGSGYPVGTKVVDVSSASAYSKYLISRIINNDALGVTPMRGTTMYIKYRVGGGAASNIATGALNTISSLKLTYSNCDVAGEASRMTNKIKNSITVENTCPSVSGRDMMSVEELKNYIKYNKGEQNRCVTVKDYHSRMMQMPAEYGCPFRLGVSEENNKIVAYILGLDSNRNLSSVLPKVLATNLQKYISEYRMINDYVEMKSGRIVNLSFEADVYIDKNYSKANVTTNIINTIKDYMDINKHQMGDNIFIGDLQKEISNVDGVINIIDLRVYNECDEEQGYSPTQTTQEVYSESECNQYYDETLANNRYHIDLKASDYILYSENDTMFEIKYPAKDIRIQLKQLS